MAFSDVITPPRLKTSAPYVGKPNPFDSDRSPSKTNKTWAHHTMEILFVSLLHSFSGSPVVLVPMCSHGGALIQGTLFSEQDVHRKKEMFPELTGCSKKPNRRKQKEVLLLLLLVFLWFFSTK